MKSTACMSIVPVINSWPNLAEVHCQEEVFALCLTADKLHPVWQSCEHNWSSSFSTRVKKSYELKITAPPTNTMRGGLILWILTQLAIVGLSDELWEADNTAWIDQGDQTSHQMSDFCVNIFFWWS